MFSRAFSQTSLETKRMGRPTTLLEGLCGHALSLGAQSIEVQHKDSRECVFANKGGAGVGIANYPSSSTDGKELRGNLHAATKKPVRTVIGGKVYILKVRVFDSFGEDAFEVSIDPAPKLYPSIASSFTAKQGQYLAFIYHYTKIHRHAPAETDLERYFRVSPPAIHDMIKTLERNGLIEKTPGQARSIRLLVQPEHLPQLE
jgi:repressor LexA